MVGGVAIVVTPWQQFRGTEDALENIYACTQMPFELVYFDNNSPPRTKHYLEREARKRNFTLVRSENFCCSNEARNIALQYVNAPYVVFIDNGVRVSQGWLEALVDCADETGAWIVAPLYCSGDPTNPVIYASRPELRITLENGRRHLTEEPGLLRKLLADVRAELRRAACTFAKFHCMLVRTDVFHRLGPLDENYLSLEDHRAFCLAVQDAGGSIYFEPGAIVTLTSASPAWNDIPFFLLRWSDAWVRPSIERLAQQWSIDPADDGLEGLVRFRNMSRRKLFGPAFVCAGALHWRLRAALEKAMDKVVFEQLLERTVVRQLKDGHRDAAYRVVFTGTAETGVHA